MKSIYLILIFILSQNILQAKTAEASFGLLDAAIKGDLPQVQRELQTGVDINAGDEQGNSALHFATMKSNFELTKFLLEKGANINQKDGNGDTPLANASSVGNMELVKFLIEKGAEVDSKNQTGWTPLRWASNEGYLPIVNYLLEKGADNSPLYLADRYFVEAAKDGNLEEMQKYLRRGARVDAVDEEGFTAML